MAIENFELFDEIMLKVMQNYEYDYEEIAKDLFRGEIVFYDYDEEDTSSKYYCELDSFLKYNSTKDSIRSLLENPKPDGYNVYDGELVTYKTIKYEEGILKFGGYEINNIDDIVETFNILVECLTKHGEYLKTYLQKRSELEKKLGFLDEDEEVEEDTNVDENKTDDLF